MRFWNNDVLTRTDAVIEAIWNAVGDRTLTPTPLPRGDGLIRNARSLPLPTGEGRGEGTPK